MVQNGFKNCMAANDSKQLDMTGKGQEWFDWASNLMEMACNGWTWMEMAWHCLKLLDCRV